MKDVIKVKDLYYVMASSAHADDRTRVLKDGETFAVFNRKGDLHPVGLGEQGLYHRGTRYLSKSELNLQGKPPLLLSSVVKTDNASLAVDLTNADISNGNARQLPRGSLHLFRSKFLWDAVCYERIVLRNYQTQRLETVLSMEFDADFRDLFEVRGHRREKRGKLIPVQKKPGDLMVFGYEGLDGLRRITRIRCSENQARGSQRGFQLELVLQPKEEKQIFITVVCESRDQEPVPLFFEGALQRVTSSLRSKRLKTCSVTGSNEQFNALLDRSASDLDMMTTQTSEGPYPYAGVPWFSAPFGRDGIITAWSMLEFNPSLAAGVLRFLARHQADKDDPARDAEVGKVLHEFRDGEMAKTGEIPYGAYYGGVDSTPLFVLLACRYWKRTGDQALMEQIAPSLERSLAWMRSAMANSGFLEYTRRSSNGLIQQGWKDSHDSVFYSDGRDAEMPVALCEVQAYVYAALLDYSGYCREQGKDEEAQILSREAGRLKEKFEKSFWCPDIGMPALAVAGGSPCRVRSSNAGHTLFSGILDVEKANLTAETLMSDDLFTGWGVRTLAASENRYNPMSYHNGSVWPHDNAIVALGLASIGRNADAGKLFQGMMEASFYTDLHRLPELFCGFQRRPGEGPTLYPVACSPQSWACAAPFLMLQAMIGLGVDGRHRKVTLQRPSLPSFLDELWVRGLEVAGARVDFRLYREDGRVGLDAPRKPNGVEVEHLSA